MPRAVNLISRWWLAWSFIDLQMMVIDEYQVAGIRHLKKNIFQSQIKFKVFSPYQNCIALLLLLLLLLFMHLDLQVVDGLAIDEDQAAGIRHLKQN